jgi:hypothetical protein
MKFLHVINSVYKLKIKEYSIQGLLFIMMFFNMFLSQAQIISHVKSVLDSPKKVYFSWGYHRAFFSNSDLHFRNYSLNSNNDASGNYDFVIKNAKAQDRPDFSKINDVKNISVPQFNVSLGFTSKYKNLGFEINYNHVKYVVNPNQTLAVKGQIFGQNIDSNMLLKPDYFHVEHTDGANFWMANITKLYQISSNKKFVNLSNMIKIGGGMCIPRTDITFMGKRTNNRFHIAGYVLGIENGIQVNFGKHLYIENSYKYAFSYFTNAKVSNDKNAYLTHSFNSFLIFLNLGVKF